MTEYRKIGLAGSEYGLTLLILLPILYIRLAMYWPGFVYVGTILAALVIPLFVYIYRGAHYNEDALLDTRKEIFVAVSSILLFPLYAIVGPISYMIGRIYRPNAS